MKNGKKRWELLNKSKINNPDEIIDALLKNRNIKNKKEFFNPLNPNKISLKSLGVKESEVKKAIERIKKAKRNKEKVIVYGDYDADGITATAIMWEALHTFGLDVLPHIPDRFEEGYGINPQSIENLKSRVENLKLIVTVDNGIVGYEGVKAANKLGIDVIVVDHHTKGDRPVKAFSIIHSTDTSGSGLSWFFAQQLVRQSNTLELAAIGTIADQLPLVDVNRSIVKYGLVALNETKRHGLLALFEEGRVENVGTYEVGYIIAPRINAMGRLKHGIESLRLLCTKDKNKAFDIAKNIGSTNIERQKIVEQVIILARKNVTDQKVIVIAGENYHEGVIGLAAGRLVEEFYRPAIVLSTKGDISKASARSISGFNIIEAIRGVNLHLEGGGHPMAAGFSIDTNKIDKFTKEINKYADKLLVGEILEKKLKIDCELNFDQLNYDLLGKLQEFEPTGIGNPGATFVTKKVQIVEVKPVGKEKRHLKLKLKQGEYTFDSIFFGGGEMYPDLAPEAIIDIVYSLEDNSWNGYKNLQLKIKDIIIT
ncbi:MAG TPA: single-stranded-DNA-specific exonuclease RecJ [Patescibacteria group bacterium]|nr:single-stranded-DNA-specific exonuclease RecJ [Patescibacteria group bacterium]